MLTAARVIWASALQDTTVLQAEVKTTWSTAYANDQRQRAQNAINTYVGIDKTQTLRSATATLNTLQDQALKDLVSVKKYIEQNFKATADELLNNLGYNAHWRAANQSRNQESLVELLERFKNNLSDERRAAFVNDGLPEAKLDAIIAAANLVQEANEAQEENKDTKAITTEAVTEFNGIYDEVMTLCKLAYDYYKSNPEKQGRYSFSAVVNRLGQSNTTEEN